MFIDKNSIVINSVNMGQYLVEAKFGFNKLWGKDSGRNLDGEMTGTLKGIYPKLTLKFRKLTKNELEIVIPILDSSSQSTTYYDPYKKQSVTMDTYTGDYEIVNRYIINGDRKNEEFDISFIAVRKRA